MRIGIVGWGIEGRSAYRFFGSNHEYLIVNEEPRDDFPETSDKVKVRYLPTDRPPGVTGSVTDLSYLEGIAECDKIIYTPISYKNLQKAFGDDPNFWQKTTTVLHIFFEESKTKNIIGVTGTKGKGTTSTLIAKMLQASGKSVHLAGNIGESMLDFLKDLKPDDWVVLELANFQLHNFTRSPHIAVCLMIAPEHLDWHPDLKEYIASKATIFKHQKPKDIAIFYAENEYSKEIASKSLGKKVPYYQKPGASVREDGMIVIGEDETEVVNKSEVKLIGEHNLQNICAALTAFKEATWDLDPFDSPPSGGSLRVKPEPVEWLDAARQVLSSFSGLEHRLELVREFEGVKYYNDSFAATPDATIGAIEAIPEPKIMIIGGYDRHLPLSHLAETVRKHPTGLSKILLIGASAKRVAKELDKVNFKKYEMVEAQSMPEIVTVARENTHTGEAVVLSPGFPSFDMFKNFTERGLRFKEAVNDL